MKFRDNNIFTTRLDKWTSDIPKFEKLKELINELGEDVCSDDEGFVISR